MNRESGFSLIELMCAILILGVGVVGLTRGITNALTSSKEAEVQTHAALIAAGRMETVRAEPFIDEGESSGACGDELPSYQWKQSVTSTRIEGLYEVEVTVENSKTGNAIYSLKTMLFDVPISSATSENSKSKSGSADSRKKRRNRE